ncbi:MAG: hypothetical protein LBC63_06005 [Holophagales bacterium]|jgi:hypothetical protein|nr:hypothetical protein [Holophagales bacterium]
MGKAKYHFEGLEYLNKPKNERPSMVEFSATKDGKTATIITNDALEGLFYWNRHTHSYSQEKGTCQFNMLVSKATARRRLIKQWINEHGEYHYD